MDDITPEITRDIYGMPAFVTMTVADISRTVDWYVNGLDFISLFSMPGPDARPALVHLRRWRYQDILVRPGLPPAGGEWTLSFLATAEQLDAVAERARRHGGGLVDGPAETPWNTRDLRLTDPDGYTVVYTARRPEGRRDERFDAMMEREARRQLGDH
ncbi:VOC family protein [Micromonospora endolithica]|uniref:VOC family protein n=1 Tax=Micromonospora endolithica TaxID=230091 RepID=A0A3A9Z6R0_9ACTN|nr:VOC family protein [Micromonospora endolithica]RKN43544.1 VOC family protein [Micromonospora endolithica]TWJ24137.1 glyoxalase/bleomycin resistance protein/dioxygenase superfamily protein [Micromonospora endolithica]